MIVQVPSLEALGVSDCDHSDYLEIGADGYRICPHCYATWDGTWSEGDLTRPRFFAPAYMAFVWKEPQVPIVGTMSVQEWAAIAVELDEEKRR